MPDDTPSAKLLHVVRLVAIGGGMSLEDARALVARAVPAAPPTPLPWLYIALVGIACFSAGWLAGVLS